MEITYSNLLPPVRGGPALRLRPDRQPQPQRRGPRGRWSDLDVWRQLTYTGETVGYVNGYFKYAAIGVARVQRDAAPEGAPAD